MQVQVADAGTLAKRITISYTAAEVAERKGQLIKRLASEVKMDGFRPGKVSKAMLEKRYGAAAQAQTEEGLADEGLQKAVTEHKIRPFGGLTNESVSRDNGFTIVVSCEVFPEVTLPEPSAFQLEKGDDQASDTEVEEAVQGIARRLGEMQPLADGETIIADDAITLTGTLATAAGAEIKKLHDFHHLVGGYPLFGKPPADVIAALAGKKVGDQLAIDATLPANFTPAEHAGQPAKLSVTVQSATRLRGAEMNDELAKKVGAPDVATLRSMLKARLSATKTNQLRGKQVEQLMTQLMDKTNVQVPPKTLAATIEQAVQAAAERAKADNKDVAAAEAEAKANVEKGAKRHIIMTVLGDRLGIDVTNDDFRDQILMAAQQTGRKAQDIADQLKKSGQINQVAMEIREAKAIEAFLDQVLGKPAAAAQA